MEVVKITSVDGLKEAYDGSYYTIEGAGGDLDEWVNGYEELLKKADIGTPSKWVTFKGELVNRYAEDGGKFEIKPLYMFKPELTFLAFPLDGMQGGLLSIFRLKPWINDKWFDDIVCNMRRNSIKEDAE